MKSGGQRRHLATAAVVVLGAGVVMAAEEAEYVEVQPLKVDSTDESSLILPWEMRDGGRY